MAQVGKLAHEHRDAREDGAHAHTGEDARSEQKREVRRERRRDETRKIDGEAHEDDRAAAPAVRARGKNERTERDADARRGKQPAQR